MSIQIVLAAVCLGITLLGPLCEQGWAQEFTVGIEGINQNWNELSPRQRERALENYRRFQQLPPEQQRTIQEQYNRWQSLPPEERARIKGNYQRYQKMDSEQKKEFRRKYEQWRSRER